MEEAPAEADLAAAEASVEAPAAADLEEALAEARVGLTVPEAPTLAAPCFGGHAITVTIITAAVAWAA